MGRHHIVSLCCLAGAMLGGCSYRVDAHMPGPGCLAGKDVRRTQVANANQVDFVLRDRRVLRNTLPNGCRNLLYVGAFEMTSPKPDICPGDQLVVRNRAGGPGESGDDYCTLGQFAPITPDKGR